MWVIFAIAVPVVMFFTLVIVAVWKLCYIPEYSHDMPPELMSKGNK